MWAVAQTVLSESFSEPDDFVTDRWSGLVRGCHRPFGEGLECVVAAVAVESHKFVDAGFEYAVVLGDESHAAFFNDEGVDEEPGLVNGNPCWVGVHHVPRHAVHFVPEPEHPLALTVLSQDSGSMPTPLFVSVLWRYRTEWALWSSVGFARPTKVIARVERDVSENFAGCGVGDAFHLSAKVTNSGYRFAVAVIRFCFGSWRVNGGGCGCVRTKPVWPRRLAAKISELFAPHR